MYLNKCHMSCPFSCWPYHFLCNKIGVKVSSFNLQQLRFPSWMWCTSLCFLCGKCSLGLLPHYTCLKLSSQTLQLLDLLITFFLAVFNCWKFHICTICLGQFWMMGLMPLMNLELNEKKEILCGLGCPLNGQNAQEMQRQRGKK